MDDSWQVLVSEVRSHLEDTIAGLEPPLPQLEATNSLVKNVCGVPRAVLTSEEVAITETPVGKLLAALASGQISSVKATNAFLRRAAVAQRLTNCVFELLPGEALSRAKELDDYLTDNKRPIGPLHGLPVSIKARVPWKGLRNTEGFVANLKDIAPEDGKILEILRSLGSVPYVRTTEPQALMMLENISNIHGSTANPHNTTLSPGGSSGGEGALLALWGSPLGLGSDIGGSLRSPAANCGIYTLKPSIGRLPMAGLKSFMSGCETIVGTVGPMTPSREGVAIFMKSILDTKPWESDPLLLPIPWRQLHDPFGTTINVGILWDDGVVSPSRAMRRALQEVAGKLEQHPRFSVREWKPFQTSQALEILEKLYSPDAGGAFKRACARSGEPELELTSYRLLNGPGIEALDIQGYWNWTKARDVFRANHLKEWISKAPDMHVILCPPHPSAAPPIGTSKYWGYTSVWNLLDYPAVVFPVTRVDPKIDREESSYTPRNEIDAWCHKYYDAEAQEGAPVSLQLVGKRLHDELVVEAMNEMCEAIGLPFVDCLRPGSDA